MRTSRLANALLVFSVTMIAACGGGGGSAPSSNTSTSPSGTSTNEAGSNESLFSSAPSDISPLAKPVKSASSSSPSNSSSSSSVLSSASTSSSSLAAATLAPLALTTDYAVSSTELVYNGDFSNQLYFWALADPLTTGVSSELRTGGRALLVNSWAGQKLSATTFEAGKAYSFTVVARKLSSTGSAIISAVFKDKNGTLYRNYTKPVTATTNTTYTLDFTAPAYVGMAEVSFAVFGGAQIVVESASLKMRSPIVQTEPIASLIGSYAPSNYGLAFNDEFSGSSLNRDKWFTRFVYGGATQDRLNDEQQRYRDNNNHIVSNGVLSLVARKVSSNDPAGIDYESGMIRSDWTTRYGYMEARVKMPGALGVWPAFWLNSDVSESGNLIWPPEIDIFEFVNNGVEDRTNMLHMGVIEQAGFPSSVLYYDSSFNTQWGEYYAPFNFNDDWHTIGAEWTPTTVSFYIDGKKIVTRSYEWKDASGQLAGPAHILLNLAVGGNWAGRHGIDAAAFPQVFQVDWVRAYKKLN